MPRLMSPNRLSFADIDLILWKSGSLAILAYGCSLRGDVACADTELCLCGEGWASWYMSQAKTFWEAFGKVPKSPTPGVFLHLEKACTWTVFGIIGYGYGSLS
uniref:Uncharacterized protein n=1 Tax=Eutreptiella gymnastica TaxID=73025 RepID=A0A7S1IM72_9EUGL|mmetsp:Transcript_26878/g.48334  ORF Transcript_26878/g.48334 Transcript_26878/m.48334 type:complete len:103 (+) Transcript_26878:559-867(+)